MLAGAALPAPAQKQTSRPNIVITLADDLGYGDLGCYGHPTIRTPNLDRMAQEGARFTQFYSAAPVCTPSRVALMTGRLPGRSGLTRVLGPRAKGGLSANEITIAEALKPLGYATACVGKWHLGHRPEYLPTRHWFDSYFGIPYSNDMSPKTNPNPTFKNGPLTPLIRDDKVVAEEPDQNFLTQRYTDEATKFIRSSAKAGKPFFLYLPHTFPHVPLHASPKFRGKSSRGLYGDVVEELDWSVGEVLKTLREAGADRNTLVVF
ncbi:MAG: sulfatase-like hydrolase/transferase, partial [Acidobacteria bacterium]|nr:sulfatase-like hydrolase/transferase [Acidobacteriota bacterium]